MEPSICATTQPFECRHSTSFINFVRNHSPQLEGRHHSVAFHIFSARGHTEGCEAITLLDAPHQAVGVHHTNSTGHTGVWESITPNLGATPSMRAI